MFGSAETVVIPTEKFAILLHKAGLIKAYGTRLAPTENDMCFEFAKQNKNEYNPGYGDAVA